MKSKNILNQNFWEFKYLKELGVSNVTGMGSILGVSKLQIIIVIQYYSLSPVKGRETFKSEFAGLGDH